MRIVKTSVSQQVIEYLRTNITSGAWKVGDKIPSSNELEKLLGVSKVSIRIAIQQFIGLGILESKHGKGTYVINNDMRALQASPELISPEDCKDVSKVLRFRLIVEPHIVCLAAEQATPELISRLRRHVSELVASIGDTDAFLQHDVAFHLEIAEACGNCLLYKTLRMVLKESQKNMRQIIQMFGYTGGVYYHSRILKALEDSNPKQAMKIMAEHMQSALEQL